MLVEPWIQVFWSWSCNLEPVYMKFVDLENLFNPTPSVDFEGGDSTSHLVPVYCTESFVHISSCKSDLLGQNLIYALCRWSIISSH